MKQKNKQILMQSLLTKWFWLPNNLCTRPYGAQSFGDLKIRRILSSSVPNLNLCLVGLEANWWLWHLYIDKHAPTHMPLEESFSISYLSFLISKTDELNKVTSKILNNSQILCFIFEHLRWISFPLYLHIYITLL